MDKVTFAPRGIMQHGLVYSIPLSHKQIRKQISICEKVAIEIDGLETNDNW